MGKPACLISGQIKSKLDKGLPLGNVNRPESDLIKSKPGIKSPLGTSNKQAGSPDSTKKKKILRKDIRLKSPKSPKSPRSLKRKDIKGVKQRHLQETKENKSNIVSKIVQSFEMNQVNCVNVCQNNTKNLLCENDESLKSIKPGSVRSAFEILMSRKGADLTPRTPRKKNLKRLNFSKSTSGQKRLDEWVRK